MVKKVIPFLWVIFFVILFGGGYLYFKPDFEDLSSIVLNRDFVVFEDNEVLNRGGILHRYKTPLASEEYVEESAVRTFNVSNAEGFTSSSASAPGGPDLPMENVEVPIPDESVAAFRAGFEVKIKKWTIRLVEENVFVPHKESMELGVLLEDDSELPKEELELLTREVERDEFKYRQNEIIPSVEKIVEKGGLFVSRKSGKSVVSLHVAPFSYNPKQQLLYKNIIELEVFPLNDLGTTNTEAVSLFNFSKVNAQSGGDLPIDLLIVTNNSFKPLAENFKQYREGRSANTNVDIVTIEEIITMYPDVVDYCYNRGRDFIGPCSARVFIAIPKEVTAIKRYVNDYAQDHTYPMLLLMGKHPIIPSMRGKQRRVLYDSFYGIPNYPEYTFFDIATSPGVAQFPVGRLPFANASEFNVMFNKIKEFESGNVLRNESYAMYSRARPNVVGDPNARVFEYATADGLGSHMDNQNALNYYPHLTFGDYGANSLVEHLLKSKASVVVHGGHSGSHSWQTLYNKYITSASKCSRNGAICLSETPSSVEMTKPSILVTNGCYTMHTHTKGSHSAHRSLSGGITNHGNLLLGENGTAANIGGSALSLSSWAQVTRTYIDNADYETLGEAFQRSAVGIAPCNHTYAERLRGCESGWTLLGDPSMLLSNRTLDTNSVNSSLPAIDDLSLEVTYQEKDPAKHPVTDITFRFTRPRADVYAYKLFARAYDVGAPYVDPANMNAYDYGAFQAEFFGQNVEFQTNRFTAEQPKEVRLFIKAIYEGGIRYSNVVVLPSNMSQESNSPVLSITTNPAGSTFSDGTVNVTIEASDVSGIEPNSMRVYFDNDRFGFSSLGCPSHSRCNATLHVPDYDPGAHEIKVTVSDVFQNSATEFKTITFTNGGVPSEPSVQIYDPSEGEGVSGEVPVRVGVTGSASITQLDIYVDDVYKYSCGAVTTCEYNLDMTQLSDGVHSVGAKAINLEGEEDYKKVNVNVSNEMVDEIPPTVTINSPVNNVQVSGVVNVVSSSSDNVGVSATHIFIDGILRKSCGAVTSCVYDWDTSSLVEKSYAIRIVANDAAGNSGDASVNVSVDQPEPTDSESPTINLVSPSSGDVSGSIVINASATDNVGVAQMNIYLGSAFLKQCNQNTCVFNLDTTSKANGTHTIKVTASDSAGNVGNVTRNINILNDSPTTPVPTTPVPTTPVPTTPIPTTPIPTTPVPTTPTPTSPSDTQNPVVTIISPSGGVVSGEVTISGTASDNVGIKEIIIYLGTNSISKCSSSSCSANLQSASVNDGNYTIRITAEDNAGNIGEATRNITISNNVANQKAQILSPSANSSLGGSSQVFNVSIGTNVVYRNLYIKGAQSGQSYFSGLVVQGAQSITADNLPTNGEGLIVTLASHFSDSTYEIQEYNYTAYNVGN